MKVYVIEASASSATPRDGDPVIREEFSSVEEFKQAVRDGSFVVADGDLVIAGTKIEITKEQPKPVFKFNHEPLKKVS